jgi:hypothetical protein
MDPLTTRVQLSMEARPRQGRKSRMRKQMSMQQKTAKKPAKSRLCSKVSSLKRRGSGRPHFLEWVSSVYLSFAGCASNKNGATTMRMILTLKSTGRSRNFRLAIVTVNESRMRKAKRKKILRKARNAKTMAR